MADDEYVYDEVSGEWRPASELQAEASATAVARDSSGQELANGDQVTLIKDLKVKGTSTTLKQGTVIRSIRLTDNPEEVDCRHESIKGLVLRTAFLRKRCRLQVVQTFPTGAIPLRPRVYWQRPARDAGGMIRFPR